MFDAFFRKIVKEYIVYQIVRPHKKGHGIHAPYLFEFLTKVVYPSKCHDETLLSIELWYNSLLQNEDVLEIEDMGAGSASLALRKRKVKEIARVSSASVKYGQLMHRLVQYLQPQTIIELGTCLGVGTVWMAAGNHSSKVFTIEGSSTLFNRSVAHFNQLGLSNISCIQGNFNHQFPVLLGQCKSFGILYIDGNHQKEATLRYFTWALECASNDSVIILDDIRWSQGMYEAWLEICCNQRVSVSLDFFRLGMVFLNPKMQKEHFKIYY